MTESTASSGAYSRTVTDQTHRDSVAEKPEQNVSRFTLNHPKNYFGVPLAVAVEQPTTAAIRTSLVDAPYETRRGAEELGLITAEETLTPLGEAIVVTAVTEYGSAKTGLETFSNLYRSAERFITALPEWRATANQIVFQYAPAVAVVEFLREQGPLSLRDLAWLLWDRDSELAETVFLRSSEIKNVTPGSRPQSEALASPEMFQSHTAMQFKTFLYHCGILTSRGADSSTLDPTSNVWEIEK